MFKKMLGRRITVIRHAGEDVDPLTSDEENALRYAAGYVCKQFKSKLKRSSHPQILKEELISCMDTLREYGNETTDDSSRWTTSCGTSVMICIGYLILCHGGRSQEVFKNEFSQASNS